jgi:hypothetical protein
LQTARTILSTRRRHPTIVQQLSLTVRRFNAPFESSSVFPAVSSDSVQAEESFCPQSESPSCSTQQQGHTEPAEATIKPEPGQQNLQIDCRANQPPYYHSIKQECQNSCQDGSPTALHECMMPVGEVERMSCLDTMGTLPQEPTSYESSRLPDLHHSPSIRPPSFDKVSLAMNPSPCLAKNPSPLPCKEPLPPAWTRYKIALVLLSFKRCCSDPIAIASKLFKKPSRSPRPYSNRVTGDCQRHCNTGDCPFSLQRSCQCVSGAGDLLERRSGRGARSYAGVTHDRPLHLVRFLR